MIQILKLNTQIHRRRKANLQSNLLNLSQTMESAIITKKRGPKKGSRSDYNIYMKSTTPIIRAEYENIKKTRGEQYAIVRAGWPEIKKKLNEMKNKYNLKNTTREEQTKIASVLVLLEKEGWE